MAVPAGSSGRYAEESTGESVVRLSNLEGLIADEHDLSSTELATLLHSLECYV